MWQSYDLFYTPYSGSRKLLKIGMQQNNLSFNVLLCDNAKLIKRKISNFGPFTSAVMVE